MPRLGARYRMRKGPDFTPGILLVVGYPRSGTSLLRDLINLSDEVGLAPEELKVFPSFVSAIVSGDNDKAKKILRQSSMAFFDPVGVETACKEIFTNVQSRQRCTTALHVMSRKCGNELKYVGEKTPQNYSELARIEELIGPVTVIWIYRDPRSVSDSVFRAWGGDRLSTARGWSHSMMLMEQRLRQAPDRSFVLSYESLVGDPKRTLGNIASFLKIDNFSDCLPQFGISRERYGKTRGACGVVNQANRQLSAKTRGVEYFCGRLMLKYGYSHDATKYCLPFRFILKESWHTVLHPARSVARQVRDKGVVGGFVYKLRQIRSKYV